MSTEQAKMERTEQAKMERKIHRYPHVEADSLYWNKSAQKWAGVCTCEKCECAHVRFAHDFFQATLCPQCSRARREKAREKIRKKVRSLIALGPK